MRQSLQSELVDRISILAEQMTERRERFLADLIRIRSYTGQEKPAVERTLAELRAIGCDEVWQDSAGNALGRIGRGPRVILCNAHLDTNEVADEGEWPHPPLEPVVEGDTLFGLGALRGESHSNQKPARKRRDDACHSSRSVVLVCPGSVADVPHGRHHLH